MEFFFKVFLKNDSVSTPQMDYIKTKESKQNTHHTFYSSTLYSFCHNTPDVLHRLEESAQNCACIQQCPPSNFTYNTLNNHISFSTQD